MATRARFLFVASLVAIPGLGYTGACFAHNGRDVGDSELAASARPRVTQGMFIDIFDGIAISVDPRTGVRTYTQVGDIPANPARARSTVAAGTSTHGVDYWVDKSFAPSGGGYVPSTAGLPGSQLASNDEGYSGDQGYYSDYSYGYGYGGYLGYGYGGGGHRPGHGHGGGGGGGGRPGHGGGGGGWGDGPRPSPPAGPYGGGVGSPPPYPFDRGVGAPPPVLRYNSFRGRRG